MIILSFYFMIVRQTIRLCSYDNSGENPKTYNHIIEKMAWSSFKTVYSVLLLKDIQAPIPLYRTGGRSQSGQSKKSSNPDKF